MEKKLHKNDLIYKTGNQEKDNTIDKTMLYH